jgi:transposase
MELVHRKCAGLDVHKDVIVACARIVEERGVRRELKRFGTTTTELLALADWMQKLGVTAVIMEATGIYWRPVWNVLEGMFELTLANAAHVKNVPGRKSDVQDAEWLGELLAHGLVRGSFVPPRDIQEMRELTRTRKQLVAEITQHCQRLQKVLETGNVRLPSVVSDILGATGRAIIRALAKGENDRQVLAGLAEGRLRQEDKQKELVIALEGRLSPHHRFLLGFHLDTVEHLEKQVGSLEERIDEVSRPLAWAIDLLDPIPGISRLCAQVVISEIGVDMKRFPTVGHLLSWIGLCPRSDESAGKIRSRQIRKGNRWFKATFMQAAWAACRCKTSYYRSQYLRIKARRGAKKAVVALAASMVTAIYYMLRDGVAFQDLGPKYLEKRDKARLAAALVDRLNALGYQVQLPAAA